MTTFCRLTDPGRATRATLLGASLMVTGATGVAATAHVVDFAGEGNAVTEIFEAPDHAWTVCWEFDDPRLKIELLDGSGAIRSIIALNDPDGVGCSYYFASGSFRLQVTTNGSWSLVVSAL